MTDTLSDWLPKLLSIEASSVNDAIWQWTCPVDLKRFERWYARLEKVVAWKSPHTGEQAKKDKGRRSHVIGKIYEKLLRVLFDGRGALSAVRNIRTSTNEIDLLLKVEPVATALPFLRGVGTHIIGEAKCHQKAPSSELVNEFVGFLQSHNARYGILFVFATSRAIASECRISIAMHFKDGFAVVPIGRKQLNEVRAGAPFLRVLRDQHLYAINHATKLHI